MINPLFKRSLTTASAVVFGTTSLFLANAALADDGIFPSAPAAKATIDFDGKGFIIHGKRTFIASGSLHYSRVPRELWRDRLLKYKRAGINTVETYTFWNVHEPQRGQFNFTGDADLGAFLSLAQSLGMMAIVRVGPYSCAEWDSGGYPIWLRNVPGVEVRKNNEPFKKAVGEYFDKLLPIIANHQISKGGNVVMVQLENEHPEGWGKEMPNDYFRFLRDKFLAASFEIPYFFSGLHHGNDPAGDNSWDSRGRTNPWFTTEFWPGWYNMYGPFGPADLRKFDRGTWKILAYGGNGYNYYMLHGGTNFDYFNGHENMASYDYSAAVGQAGDLRPIYYRFKRAAQFATSFPEILENSENADATYQNRVKVTTGGPLKITARTSLAGDIAFLDNNRGQDKAQIQFLTTNGTALPSAGPITLNAGEIIPIVQNAQLAPDIKLDVCAARVLGVSHEGKTTTLVIYGNAGDPFEAHFSAGDTTVQADPAWKKDGASLKLHSQFEDGVGQTYTFKNGDQTVRVLAVSGERADKTWFAQEGDKDFVVSGPSFLRDISLQNGRLSLQTETPWDNPGGGGGTYFAYGEATAPIKFEVPIFNRLRPNKLALTEWQSGGGAEPTAPTYDDSKWLSSPQPLQMGFDGDVSSYAWYRAVLNAPSAGQFIAHVGMGNSNLYAFLDGNPLPKDTVKGGNLPLDLAAGKHEVTFFTSHNGRDKFFNHLGNISEADRKGLFGPATLSQTQEAIQTVGNWKVLKLTEGAPVGAPPVVDGTWKDTQIGEDVFGRQAGRAWFSATLPELKTTEGRVVHFGSVDEDATVYLNGVKIGEHKGWNQAFDLPLDANWKTGGPNQLTVFINNESYAGGIDQPVTVTALGSSTAFTNWKMRGGPSPTPKTWKASPTTPTTGPQWYRTTFNTTAPGSAAPIWRLKTKTLSRGSVWLNGHNLGRYPERVPVDGMYLPESWIKAGVNTIEIFDEEGNSPVGVAVESETAASRDLQTLTSR